MKATVCIAYFLLCAFSEEFLHGQSVSSGSHNPMVFVVECPRTASPRGSIYVGNDKDRGGFAETAKLLQRDLLVIKRGPLDKENGKFALEAAMHWSTEGNKNVGIVYVSVTEPIKLRIENQKQPVKIRKIGGEEIASEIDLPPGDYAFEIVCEKLE